jgi:hypothetical protein
MLERLRNQIGTAGLVVAIVALVAALGGGAYAATGGPGGGKATASAKAKKGPRGPKGATGPAGPAGAKGDTGAKGDAGANGSNGSSGAPGADGKSVTGETIASGGACGLGVTGVKYTLNATSTNVCNGKNGTTGFTETLPSGKTETGLWGVGEASGPGNQTVPISFPIPLENVPDVTTVWLSFGTSNEPFEPFELEEILEEGAEHGCPGFDEGVPLADPGHLCVYIDSMLQMKPTGTGLTNTIRSTSEPPQIYTGGTTIPKPPFGGRLDDGVGRVGAFMLLSCGVSANCVANGAWAVTAE